MEWLERWHVAAKPTHEDKIYAVLEAFVWSLNAGLVIRSFTAIWR